MLFGIWTGVLIYECVVTRRTVPWLNWRVQCGGNSVWRTNTYARASSAAQRHSEPFPAFTFALTRKYRDALTRKYCDANDNITDARPRLFRFVVWRDASWTRLQILFFPAYALPACRSLHDRDYVKSRVINYSAYEAKVIQSNPDQTDSLKQAVHSCLSALVCSVFDFRYGKNERLEFHELFANVKHLIALLNIVNYLFVYLQSPRI